MITLRRVPLGTLLVTALLGLLAVLAAAPAAPALVAQRAGWVEVTDTETGVSVELPADAEPVEVPFGRAYVPDRGDVAFVVVEVPGAGFVGLDTLLDTVGPQFGATVVESTETTVDGHDALDAVISVDRDDVRGIALVRGVVTDGGVVVLATRADSADDADAKALHRRLLDGARFA